MEKPNLTDIIAAAQKVQQSMKQTQEELAKIEVIGESGAGLVKVHMNGIRHVTHVTIDPSVLSEDIQVIQALTAGAFNDAMKKVEKKAEEKVRDLAKGFNLPDGLSGMGDR